MIRVGKPFLMTVLMVGSLPGGCDRAQQAPPPQTQEVAVVTVQPRPTVLTRELPGRTAAFLVSDVRPQVSGLVQKRLFTEGSDVKAGDPLFQIDPAQFRAAYDNAKANMDAAVKAVDRARAAVIASAAGVTRQEATLSLAKTDRQRYKAPLRAEPQNERDLIIAANNGWIIGYDNMSIVPHWLTDALCRISTGSGFATRELYSNSEEIIFQVSRPVILNGIGELTDRSDLLDRSIVLQLKQIPDSKRRTEAELTHMYEKARPRILGRLLDAVSAAMRNVGNVKLDSMPRMADFAKWAVAAEPALGLTQGLFMSAHQKNRSAADETALDASTIGRPIQNLMNSHEYWEGTYADLQGELERQNPEVARSRVWPRSAKMFRNEIVRITPNLRQIGIEVDSGPKTNRGRIVQVRRTQDDSSTPSLDVAPSPFDDEGEAGADVALLDASDDGDGSDGPNQSHSEDGREEVDL